MVKIDMEMPPYCSVCPLYFFSSVKHCFVCRVTQMAIVYPTWRDKHCPMIECEEDTNDKD